MVKQFTTLFNGRHCSYLQFSKDEKNSKNNGLVNDCREIIFFGRLKL